MSHSGHGMNMGAGGEAYVMKMYFHFSATDYMLFLDWLPTASNHFAAACIFCVALGMFDRLLAAFRGALEARWHYQRTHDLSDSTLSDKLSFDGRAPTLPNRRAAAWAAPFSVSVDPVRAVMHGFQAFISFVLMLVAMTFNFWYVLSLSVGIALGTLLFGRYAANESAASHC